MESFATVSVGLACFAAGAETVRWALSPLSIKQTNGRKQHVEGMYWGLVFLFAFALEVKGFISPTSFVVLGAVAFVRFFGTKHEANHVHFLPTMTDHALQWGHRFLDIPASPFEMCQDDLTDCHKGHHKAWMPNSTYPDPDAYMTQSWWPIGLLHCIFESEQAMPRHVWETKGKTLGRSIVWAVYKSLWLYAVWYYTGWEHLKLWLLACRIANGGGLFIFHNLLHKEPVYSDGLPFASNVPSLFSFVWRVILGEDLLNAVVYHKHHHHHPIVPVEALDVASPKKNVK